jgi:hypothetical protein
MMEITTLRIWIGITCAWPLLWAVVFDRWFYLSPLGILFVFGLPVAGWVLWFLFYRGEEEKIASDGRLVADAGADLLLKLKNSIKKR